MFKKIGISWALFIVLFSLENYAASFTYNGYTYSYQNLKWSKKDNSGNVSELTVQDLLQYLKDQKDNVLKKLERLILASGKNDLLEVSTIQAVRKHMFDHGHLGWYPFSCPYVTKKARVQENPELKPRGIFNINNATLKNIVQFNDPRWILLGVKGNVKGYESNPSLRDVANNIIKGIFLNEIKEPGFICEANDEKKYNGLIKIDVTYAGKAIDGLESGNIGLQTNSTPTNRVRIQVGVKNGRISISTIYPLG